MPQVTRVVRFYEPVMLDQKDQIVTITPDFWKKLLDQLLVDKPDERRFLYSGYHYYGEVRTAKQPARRYLYVGRLRDKDDWPDTFAPDSGAVGDLAVNGLLLEPTFVVPFGTQNYCAVMTPRFNSIAVSALESWTTAACGLTTSGNRIELRPILNEKVQEKLEKKAVGVTKLSVRLAAGTNLSQVDGGGDVGDAIRSASAAATGELSTRVEYSLGHSRGDADGRAKLLQGARWVAAHLHPSSAEVSMLIPQTSSSGEETIRSETHDLVKDRITYQSKFQVPEGVKPSEVSVMGAIQQAIDQFNTEN